MGDTYVPPLETWQDPTTGLTWQATTGGNMLTSEDASEYCASLSLDGGGWRLPTIGELRTLIRGCPGTEDGGNCTVGDGCLDSSCWIDSCAGCPNAEGPGLDRDYRPDAIKGEPWLWSSSAVGEGYEGDPGFKAWFVDFWRGGVYYNGIHGHGYAVYTVGFDVLCVR